MTVTRVFASRYLVNGALPAYYLKTLLNEGVSPPALTQLLLIYTARANAVLHDYICEIYWPQYANGSLTLGRQEAIKFLENVDVALVVIDATRTPFDQVNFTIIGNLEHQKKPFILVPNKIDLPDADIRVVKDAFQEYTVIPVSALQGDGIETLYDTIANMAKKVR